MSTAPGTELLIVVVTGSEPTCRSLTTEIHQIAAGATVRRASSLDEPRAGALPDLLIVVDDGDDASLAPQLQALSADPALPPFLAHADRRNDAALRSWLVAGARDYLTSDDPVRRSAALERELGLAAALRPRRAAEEAGRVRSWLLEAIVDSLPFVVFVKEPEELRLCLVNRTLAQVFATTKEALIGTSDFDNFPREQAESFVAIDRAVLASQGAREVEEIASPDGSARYWRTRKMALPDPAGGPAYLLGVTEEITDRRRSEEELRASKADLEEANRRLESSLQDLKKSHAVSARSLASYQQRALQMELIRQQNEDLDRLASDLARAKQLEEARAREIEQAARLKSEFLANFSHEIRTPLNGILGYCELLLREEGSRLTPHGRRDLNVVKANARTLLALINDILDLSKIESGHIEVVRSDVDIGALVEECTATVREYLQGKDVGISASVDPELRTLHTDPLKIKQVLLNLLSNAAKFTESGEIVVEVRPDGDTAVITVEDTGVGIPADQLPFVFDKFRQVDGSSTRKVGGTGLGLAIVRELTRILGGTVEVSSVLGRGSVFTVRLKGASSTGTMPSRPRSITGRGTDPTQVGPGSTILVVDDDPLIHQLLRTELEKEGFTVLLALDGVEALTVARSKHPRAIVLDIHLPKLDGWSVLTALKSDPALNGIPIIIVSVEEQRARGFALGACEYLIKPFEADQLVAMVGRLVHPGPGEVLVVDDDAATREVVARHLKRAGFSTAEAHNGEEALLRARISKPSMLILDLCMPKMDGFEVLRRLRAEDAAIPVLVLTGKSLTADEESVLRDGMTAVIVKGGHAIENIVTEARRLLLHQQQTENRLVKVLYVEDSAQNRDVVRRYLRGEFEVIEAEDGEHGLERAQRDRPALILMDLSLPKLDGWEATRRLKAGPLASIPVVALTAHASREDQARARAAGCDGYLTKPVDRDLLISTIRKQLASR